MSIRKYRVYGENGSYVESFEIPENKNYEIIEIPDMTPEEEAEAKRPLAVEIDNQYTEEISRIMRKSMEKWILDEVPIPQVIINERTRLRMECNTKIQDLGIDVEVYRESGRKIIVPAKK